MLMVIRIGDWIMYDYDDDDDDDDVRICHELGILGQ